MSAIGNDVVYLIDLSNRALFDIWGDHVSISEIFGFVTGAASVWLCVRLRASNWPIGILNDLFFLILFWSAALYANAGLQVLYGGLGVWGWWVWARGGHDRTPLLITRTSSRQWLCLVAFSLPAVLVLTWILSNASSSTVPFWDALTTVVSLGATWGQCLKKVESWYLWLVADAIYIPLYGSEHLGLTAVLYVGFFIMCIAGLRDWTNQLTEEQASLVAA
jgi:nicotinamide mononucleotide transporter